MLIKLADIRSEGIAFVWAFDKKNRALYNLGGIELESLQSSPQMSELALMDGVLHQTGAANEYAVKLFETAYANLQLWEGAHDEGATLWLLSQKETTVLKKANYTVGYTNEHSRKKPGVVPLKWRCEGTKVSDYLWKMHGMFDPTGLILLVNPALQKYAGETNIVDASPYERAIVCNGMSASAWHADKVSLKLDGVNDYLSIADTEFRGPEMLGTLDANNRTFATGVGSWETYHASNTINSVAGGQSGNGGQLFIGNATSNLMTLTEDVTAFVVGKSYQLTGYLKYDSDWNGGYVQFSIGGTTHRIVPTDSYVAFNFCFVAQTESPTIVITSQSNPTISDVLVFDTLSIREMSQKNFNLGERIISSSNRDFEQNSVGDWADEGNHTVAAAGGAYVGSYCLKLTSSGAGDQTTNYASLPADKFAALESGKKYTIQFAVKRADTTDLKLGFGATGQTKTFTLATSYEIKAWNFTAGANDVGVDLRAWNSAQATTGTLIDVISISEAVDVTIAVWFKTNGFASDARALVSTMESDHGYGINYDSGNTVTVHFYDDNANGGSLTSDGGFVPNLYYCVVVTFDKTGNMRLYINGVIDSSYLISAIGKLLSTLPLLIGENNEGGAYFPGHIGATVVKAGTLWNANEVLEFYNSTKGQYGL